MEILSRIGDAISRGYNAVCETVGKIGSSVASFANTMKPVLGPILLTVAHVVPHPVVKAVATFANALLHSLDVFKPEENVQDMGARALQAAEHGITPSKYDNDFEEYMTDLRKFDLNVELADKYTKVEKFVAGLGLATAGIESKFNAEPGSLSSIWLLPATNGDYFTPERVKGWLEHGKMIGDVSAYLENRMSGEEASDFRKGLEVTPEGFPMSDAELGKLYDALSSARTAWSDLERQVKNVS